MTRSRSSSSTRAPLLYRPLRPRRGLGATRGLHGHGGGGCDRLLRLGLLRFLGGLSTVRHCAPQFPNGGKPRVGRRLDVLAGVDEVFGLQFDAEVLAATGARDDAGGPDAVEGV